MLTILLASLSLALATPCNDGWESPSSGSGTCSHHGGVRHSYYVPPVYVPPVSVPQHSTEYTPKIQDGPIYFDWQVEKYGNLYVAGTMFPVGDDAKGTIFYACNPATKKQAIMIFYDNEVRYSSEIKFTPNDVANPGVTVDLYSGGRIYNIVTDTSTSAEVILYPGYANSTFSINIPSEGKFIELLEDSYKLSATVNGDGFEISYENLAVKSAVSSARLACFGY